MANWWVPGSRSVTTRAHAPGRRLHPGVGVGKPQGPTFKDAAPKRSVLDAILDSAKSQKWVNVARVI